MNGPGKKPGRPQKPISSLRRKRVPDRQILGSAEQYDMARKILDVQPPGTGVVLPLLNTGAMAIELYLKSMAATLVHIEEGDGVPYRVRSTPDRPVHRLVALLDAIPEPLRERLGQAFEAANSDATGRMTLREQLERLEGLFVHSRYPFDPKSKIGNYVLPEMNRLADLLGGFVRSLEPVEHVFFTDEQ